MKILLRREGTVPSHCMRWMEDQLGCIKKAFPIRSTDAFWKY